MHRDNTRGSVLIVDYDSTAIELFEIGSASDMLEVQSFIQGTSVYTHMTVVNKSGGAGNEKWWLLTDIRINRDTSSFTLTANQITFHDNTGGNTSFDWITRTTTVITDDSGFYLAYGTTGLGFAYRYEPTVSGSGMCIAMNADTPLSTINYR